MKLLLILCLAVLTTFLLLAQQKPPAPPATQPDKPLIEKITIAGETFKLEVAADDASREKGLMGRDHIDADKGMIFIHPRPELLSYWMANCLTDMDIMFLDSNGKIVATYTMKAEAPKKENESQLAYETRLKRYPSRWPAQFAIELQAKAIERLKLKPGMVITMDLDRLKAMGK